jgi:hypothetical protein
MARACRSCPSAQNTADEHVNRHQDDDACKDDVEHPSPFSEQPRDAAAGQSAADASGDDPIALMIGIPAANMRAGTIRKPPPMPKKPESAPVRRPLPRSFGKF